MKKTLGGDRLGSGKKMQVELHNYERSTHDLGYLWRSTMAAGTLVPFMSEVALPGDTFDIRLDADIKTHPTIGPLFGSYKVQLDVFQCPIRLYQGKLHNNKLGIGMNMATIKLPVIRLQANELPEPTFDIDNSQINPSCILSYLGIRGVGVNATGDTETAIQRDFNGVPLLAYWDVYKNYYANKQEEIGAVIHTEPVAIDETVQEWAVTSVGEDEIDLPEAPAIPTAPFVINTVPSTYFRIEFGAGPITNPDFIVINDDAGRKIPLSEALKEVNRNETTFTITGSWDFEKWGNVHLLNYNYLTPSEVTVNPPNVATFPLENIDSMRELILGDVDLVSAFVINSYTVNPYSWVTGGLGNYRNMMSTQEGLGLKTYQSDLFNNWISTEWIDGTGGINEITAIDTSGGSFNIDTLNLSKKVYDMLNRIAVSGGTYDDWLDAVYTHDRFTRVESPMYMGGLIKELVFQEVISNAEAETSDGAQPLGTLAGRGVLSSKHKGGQVTIKVDEPSYIMGIISITPRLDYSQGNKWDVHLKTMDDFHKPALDEIGFQELITEQMAWWDTVATTHLAGMGNFVQKSAGKQPAWLNYMTNVNQTRGNFAIKSNEMFMTLNRRYEASANHELGITDLTTYIDPAKFNHIFAQTSLDAQNFWTQIAVDITARRKMSAKIMPNL